MALSRLFRITRKTDFTRITKKGKRLRGPHFKVVFVVNRLPYARIAVVVSKKIAAKSSRRNKIRRRITEAFRTRFAKSLAGHDILLVVGSSSEHISRSETEAELLSLFRKIHSQHPR